MADNSYRSLPIRFIIELFQGLTVIYRVYILTKFGADWSLFVDARV